MPYSILSLDGGGTWALVQVRMLQQRYGDNALGHDILKNYDLVIANSGGSLVLATLCANKSLSQVRAMFETPTVLQTIFSRDNTAISHLLGIDRFSTEQKKKGLLAQLGAEASNKLMTELPEYIGKKTLQIIITGFDYDSERAVYFRSNSQSAQEAWHIETAVAGRCTVGFRTVTLLDAIHASSNAPVLFFNKPAQINYKGDGAGTEPRLFWDGAVGGNNNPVAAGVLEALANGAGRDDIRVVSIGTANNMYPVFYNEAGEPGSEAGCDFMIRKSKMLDDLHEVFKMADAIVADPPDTDTFIANQILGLPYAQTNKKLIRINPLVKAIFSDAENKWKRPGNNWDTKKLETLYTMDMAVTTKEGTDLINLLCDDFIHGYFDNQGIKTGGKKMEAILGHKKFAEAMADWKSWDPQAPPVG